MINKDFNFEPVCQVSVKNVIYNVKYVLDNLNGEKLIAVVKSNAYGHGLKLCPFIEKYVDCFAVSRWQEALSLRYMGVSKPIMLLIPQSLSVVKSLNKHNVSFCCYSYNYALALSKLKLSLPIKVNLAVDTGMNRLGFDCFDQFESALKLLSGKKNIELLGLYSHFSKGDSLKLCQKQFSKFLQFEKISRKYYSPFEHICASSGFAHKKFNLNAVRIGLMLYGYMPNGKQNVLKPALKIVANSICEKTFDFGDKCLYNFNVEKGVYSLVNLGYADGLDRNYKPKRCMDLSFEKGKGKIVIDNLLKLCKINNTIPYEILANISPRIKREYVDIYESDWW